MKISEGWGTSRDATVRRLLASYVTKQRELDEDTRLVHISTVLRYPGRHHSILDPSKSRQRVAFRIEFELEAAAMENAFRAPGQARRQARGDYAGRPLTDALTTAIALQSPFVDRGLRGIPHLLQHCEALGLWRLTIAATRTKAEREVLAGDDEDVRWQLTEGTTAWLSSRRHEVALHFARELFTGSKEKVAENRRWVGEQGEELAFHVRELERAIPGGHELTHDLPSTMLGGFEREAGRGATAVWRAKRQVALEAVAVWFTSPSPVSRSLVVKAPGWSIRQPDGWRALHFPGSAMIPSSWERLIAERRVLRIDHLSNSALWPVDKDGAPIPGIRDIIEGAGSVNALELAEAILVRSRSPYESVVDQPAVFWPGMHPDKAHELGFIDSARRDALITEAEQKTQRRMELVIAEVSSRRPRRGDPELVVNLRRVMTRPTRFARLAREHYLDFYPVPPVWHWELGCVQDALEQHATPAQLQWLGRGWLHVVRRAIGMKMEQAWHAAFHRRPDDEEV
ncbi:hypothetical protein ACFVBP_10330 [Nocardioides sp. NPDC057764]|uniref:hypothetical protein n=1 Tax=Nocardioides sp. NPDC057764 TaxID=3346243 RepID=UPI003670A26F